MKYVLLNCFLFVTVAFAGLQEENYMPDGFEQVRIGMDWRSLVAIRPNAKIMMPEPGTNLKPDPEKPKEGLEEKLSTGSFERVFYVFDNGVLVAVNFAKEQKDSSADSEQTVRKVAQKLGMPSRIGLIENCHDQGVLTWKDKNLHVNVVIPTVDAKSKKGVVGLQIMDRKYAEKIKALGVIDDIEKKNKLQDEDKATIERLRSAVKKHIAGEKATPQNSTNEFTQ